MYKFDKIIVCVDMAGCPNKCRHCWIGVSECKGVGIEQFQAVAKAFQEYVVDFEIFSWYREPDFRGDYKELWNLEKQLSTVKSAHFELASFWRLVRDESYVKWLCELGLKNCQLTLFGDEDTTDFYVGRKGAYQEILKAIGILLENGIAPRLQIFVNQENISQLNNIVELCRELELEQRCKAIGREFEIFVHAGSCDGENAKLYDIRIEAEDLFKLPDYLVEHTLMYLKKQSMDEVFGFSEKHLCSQFTEWDNYAYEKSSSPVFYVDSDFNVYPNMTSTFPWWKIGNMLSDGTDIILKRYVENDYFAARAIKANRFEDVLAAYGNRNSGKLFQPEDYYYYICNLYLKDKYFAI